MKKNNLQRTIDRITNGDKAEAKKLTDLFIKQVTVTLANLKACTEKNDGVEIKKIGHFLKSNFLALRMERPTEIAEYLRKSGGENIEETKNQVQELTTICYKIITEL
jgi:hypothetical protein